ncbi:Protein SERAC1 [Nymphon striatum]|nr:Protein SERAC1 [Nymphon striatum]
MYVFLCEKTGGTGGTGGTGDLRSVCTFGKVLSDVFDNKNDSDAMCLARTAQIIRTDMSQELFSFNGSFSSKCQEKSLSLVLIAMTLAQLLRNLQSPHTIIRDIKTTNRAGIGTILPVFVQLLQARSKDLLEKLVDAGVGRKPIIWISHSMGGLIVKQMLVNAAAAPMGTSESNVFWNSSGIVFYSVPHNGTSMATKLSTQAQYIFFPSAELKELQHGSQQLKELHEAFKEKLKMNEISCLSFGENKKTSFGLKFNAYIVDRESSDIDIGEFYDIPSNHLNVCKPENPQSKNYTKLLEFLHKKVPKSDISYQSIFNENSAVEREYFLLAFG